MVANRLFIYRTFLVVDLSLVLSLVNLSQAFPDFIGKVKSVDDGDTITVLHDGKDERMRLNGIDAPEKTQVYGNKAKQFTE